MQNIKNLMITEHDTLCVKCARKATLKGHNVSTPEFHEEYVLAFLGTNYQEKMVQDWIRELYLKVLRT